MKALPCLCVLATLLFVASSRADANEAGATIIDPAKLVEQGWRPELDRPEAWITGPGAAPFSMALKSATRSERMTLQQLVASVIDRFEEVNAVYILKKFDGVHFLSERIDLAKLEADDAAPVSVDYGDAIILVSGQAILAPAAPPKE